MFILRSNTSINMAMTLDNNAKLTEIMIYLNVNNEYLVQWRSSLKMEISIESAEFLSFFNCMMLFDIGENICNGRFHSRRRLFYFKLWNDIELYFGFDLWYRFDTWQKLRFYSFCNFLLCFWKVKIFELAWTKSMYQ